MNPASVIFVLLVALALLWLARRMFPAGGRDKEGLLDQESQSALIQIDGSPAQIRASLVVDPSPPVNAIHAFDDPRVPKEVSAEELRHAGSQTDLGPSENALMARSAVEMQELLEDQGIEQSLICVAAESLQQSAPLTSKNFRLVCVRSSVWRVGLVEIDSPDGDLITSTHQGLKRLVKQGDCWILDDLHNSIEVIRSSGSRFTISLRIPDQSLIVFKLFSSGSSGRHVSDIGRGEYLVLVPASWQRADRIAGPAQIESEQVDCTSLRAHYFSIEENGTPIAFENESGALVFMGGNSERCFLAGHAIADENESSGVLFGRALPRILFPHPEFVQQESSVELLYSGGDSDLSLLKVPVESSAAIDLSTMVSDPKSGFYKVKLSNPDKSVVQAIPFRFCARLISIMRSSELNSNAALPPQTPKQVLELLHSTECTLSLPKEHESRYSINRSDDGSVVVDLKPEPDTIIRLYYFDKACTFGVPIVLLLHKLWWCLLESPSTGEANKYEWTDSTLSIPAKLLKASSKAVLAVRLPSTRWTKRIKAGIAGNSLRSFRQLVDESVVQIKLQEFCDCKELDSPGSYTLVIECENSGKRTAYIAGSVHVSGRCKLCNFETTNNADILEHLLSRHCSELFAPISQERRNELEAGLPDGIYHCRYCDTDLVVKHFPNPEQVVLRHLEVSCHARPAADAQMPAVVRTRQDLESDIDSMKICLVCRAEFDDRILSDMSAHYTSNHKAKILQITT